MYNSFSRNLFNIDYTEFKYKIFEPTRSQLTRVYLELKTLMQICRADFSLIFSRFKCLFGAKLSKFSETTISSYWSI